MDVVVVQGRVERTLLSYGHSMDKCDEECTIFRDKKRVEQLNYKQISGALEEMKNDMMLLSTVKIPPTGKEYNVYFNKNWQQTT